MSPRYPYVMDTTTSPEQLAADARNRALRSAIQGGVSVAVVALAAALFGGLNNGQDPFDGSTWQAIGSSAVTAVLTAVSAYVMRRYADGSSLPTPLPPAPAAEPAEHHVPDLSDPDPGEYGHEASPGGGVAP